MSFRVTRSGADYLVEAMIGVGTWSQIRLGRLHDDRSGPVQAGLYACSPKGVGLEVRFENLTIWRR